MPLHVSSTCARHQVKIALHSLWYHHTHIGGRLLHETATCRCDDPRGCVMQFWPLDDEHMCSKHVEAWNKLIVKQKFCASCWVITEIKKMQNCPCLTNLTTYSFRHISILSGYYYRLAHYHLIHGNICFHLINEQWVWWSVLS